MHSITINISNEKLVEKVMWFLNLLKKDGLEIVSREDMDDLKLLRATRDDESIPFEEYVDSFPSRSFGKNIKMGCS